jgi:hypothetical protein
VPGSSDHRARTRSWARRAVLAAVVGGLLAGCSEDATDPPVLRLDPAVVTLAPGDTAGVFAIANAGRGTLTWHLTLTTPWLRCNPLEGSTATTQQVGFALVADSLRRGPTRAAIEVGSNGGDGRVEVRMWTALALAPATLDLGDTARTARVVITNIRPDTLWWTAGATRDWLTVDRAAGFALAAPETLLVRATRAGLDLGAHAGAIVVDAGALGRDSARVTLVVPNTAAVTGRVFYAATRIPVPEVEVRVGPAADTTDGTGAFALVGVPVGERTIQARRAGFDDLDLAIRVDGSGAPLELSMTSALHTHWLAGHATNRLDRGVAGALVVLLNPDGSPSGIQSHTLATGAYGLTAVPEGEQRLRWTSYLYQVLVTSVTVAPGATHDARLVAKPLDPPYLPLGPALDQLDCTTIDVDWTPRAEETTGGYRVERAPGGTTEFADVSGLVDAAVSDFPDTGASGGSLRYRVRTENIDGLIGPPSPDRTITTADWFELNNGDVGPGERWGHSAIYDPEGRRMVVFGGLGCVGHECGVLFNDTWSLDLTAAAWDSLDEGSGPSKRQDHRAVYDPLRRRMIVFGGRGLGDVLFNDTWAFDLASNRWTLLEDGSAAPPARYGYAMICDEATDRIIVYGGDRVGAVNDVWAFRLATDTWERLRSGEYGEQNPQPGGRYFAGAVYDPARRRMVVHGGCYTSAMLYRDTWALDLDTAVWTALPDGPSVRYGQAAVFDAPRDRLLLFGGSIGDTPLGDLVELSFAPEPHWRVIDDASGARPGARVYLTGVRDPERNGFVVFGGLLGIDLAKDAWAYCPAR